VGRVEELDLVIDALRDEQARGVVIAGALGVGKTRLAREAVAALSGDVAVHWAAATPATASIPFGAFAHLVPDDVASTDDRLRFLRGTIDSLRARAAGRPLVVAVDDAQWLDAGAAALVHQLVVSGGARVVLTVRSDEPVPDPIVACWKDGLTERLELQPLGVLDHDTLVSVALDRPVDRSTLRRFWGLSKGNPLFVRELVLGALETDAFTVSDGVWTWTGGAAPSTRLSAILEARFARVSAAGHAVLGHLAVGEPLALEVLTGLCGIEGVAEVEQAGLAVVDERETGDVRLAHPLYGEALRSAMGTVEQRRLMARLADAVEGVAGMSRPQLLRVATWRLESGSAAPAALFTDAAEAANAVYDHALAERLARRAVAEGDSFRAALALGDALNRQGRCLEGLEVLEPLAARAKSDQDRVAVTIARYFGLTTEFGFRADFEPILLAAEEQVRDPKLRAFVRAQRATLLCFAGRLEEGVALATRSASDEADEISELRAVPALGGAWLCGGRPASACALAERLFPVALRHQDELPQAPAWVLSTQLPSLVAAGRLDDADAAAGFVEAVTEARGASADGPSFIALARGMSALHRGLAHGAQRWLRESAAGMRPIARSRLPFVLAQLTEACALVGDADGAWAASAEADELVARASIFEGLVRRARGWAALAQGRRAAAVDLLLDAAAWSRAHGQHTAELFALHDALRLGATDAAPELIARAPEIEGRWAPAFAAHAAAVTDADGAALDAVATHFEDLGALLLAAEAAAEASATFRATGLTARADRSAARAGVLAGACEGARTPILEELARPLPLTRREREVANLAARGLSSPAIAQRLYLSVRTVDGHLQKAYAKLGVSDRRSLARLLPPGPEA
jgi:DNA-binding CsgD family transcriptional regulator